MNRRNNAMDMKLEILTFSPTGTSKAIAEAIARGIGIVETHSVDITYSNAGAQEFCRDTLTIVSVPVYGGHVAPTAINRMEGIKGNDAPVVAVVVYGNRHYEGALDQLADFLTDRGFRVIAAGTFIGEHSYSTPENPIAVGRPNSDDINVAEQFGADIMQKVINAPDAPAVDVSTIEQPVQNAETMMQFKQIVMEWMQSGKPMPMAPQTDSSLCTSCETCVEHCPTQAIPAGAPTTTNTEACIKCCACVKACPAGARTFPSPFTPLLSKIFYRPKENKTLL